LAQITGATVRASTATQYYTPGSIFEPHIDNGPWEGTVYTYDPSGKVIKIEQAPKA
jgi:hypothetical protein